MVKNKSIINSIGYCGVTKHNSNQLGEFSSQIFEALSEYTIQNDKKIPFLAWIHFKVFLELLLSPDIYLCNDYLIYSDENQLKKYSSKFEYANNTALITDGL